MAVLVDYALLARRPARIGLNFPQQQAGETWVIVGLDDRSAAGSAADDVGTGKGAPVGARADLIIVVHEVEGRRHAFTVTRDAVVRLADQTPQRIGATWTQGPQVFVDALCRSLNIPATHVVAVNMRAFVGLVDTLGGVQMTLPQALRDRRAHIELSAGTHVLNGRQTLALVRSRQGEVQVNGRWMADPEGAAGRQRRASEAMAAVLAKAKDADPLTWQRLGWRVLPDVTLDRDSSLAGLATLRNLPPITTLPIEAVPDSELATITPQTMDALRAAGYTDTCQPA